MLILINTALEAIKNGKSLLPKMVFFQLLFNVFFQNTQILIVVIASSSSTVGRSTILVLLILLLLAGVSTIITPRGPGRGSGWTPILWGLMVTWNSILLTWRGLRGLI